jgi:methionine-rich copper-binding protein CopC
MNLKDDIIRCCLVAMSLYSFTLNACAEGVLVRAEPSDNAVMTGFTGSIKLWFSGNVSERTPTLIVVNDAGERVDNPAMHLKISEQRSELSTTTKALTDGIYTVRYRVLTKDGLVVSGIYRFTVKS